MVPKERAPEHDTPDVLVRMRRERDPDPALDGGLPNPEFLAAVRRTLKP
jgi:hypothetical protein